MNILFLDFWDGFQSHNNFLLDLFQSIYPSARPATNLQETDIVIYSCFGNSHKKIGKGYKTKIFYTGENLRPNFDDCDFSLTFDYPDYGGKNIRLPLWLWQFAFFGKTDYGNPQFVLPPDQVESNKWKNNQDRPGFCVALWNNPEHNRVETRRLLAEYKQFDLFGKTSGNWFYGEEGKYDILSKYRFSVCYENAIHPGLYTEKLIHAKCSGTIPIYRADPLCHIDFNKKGFINLEDFSSIQDLVSFVKKVDENEELAIQYQQEPLFNTKDYHFEYLEMVKEQIKTILGG